MHQAKKDQQWYFDMKAHIGVDVDSSLVHTVTTKLANEADVNEADYLLHGKESVVDADARYTGTDKRTARKVLDWLIARKRGSVKALPRAIRSVRSRRKRSVRQACVLA